MKKVIAGIFLLVGIGLATLCGGYFSSEDQERCERYRATAVGLLEQARALEGTPKSAAFAEEARIESETADVACKNARQTRQRARLAAAGGLASIIVAIALFINARRRTS
jgi:hypothetical protein